jgi:hypothetical protein
MNVLRFTWLRHLITMATILTIVLLACNPPQEPGGKPTTETAGDFSITIKPEILTVQNGSSASVLIGIERTGGFTGQIEVTLEDPAKIPLIKAKAITIGEETTNGIIQIEVDKTAVAGTASPKIAAISGTLKHSVLLPVTIQKVQGDFAVRFEPANVVLVPSSSVKITARVDRVGGFNGPVSINFPNLPPGVVSSRIDVPANSSVGTLELRATETAMRGPVTLAARTYTTSDLNGAATLNNSESSGTLENGSIPVLSAMTVNPTATTISLTVRTASLSLKVEGPNTPIDGGVARSTCDDWRIDLGITSIDIPEPGWVLVKKAFPSRPQFRSVSGVVSKSKITHSDFPTLHDTHDQNTDIRLDVGQENILSDANDPGELEVEWETGTYTNETGKNAPERTFPKWVWPSIGDRVWFNGNWIVDCGHPVTKNGADRSKAEIHPPRAVATMRPQVRYVGGLGSTPRRVTSTDLYIHGRGGFITDTLNCGVRLILPKYTNDPNSCPVKTSRIDENFEFDILAPP